MKEVTSRNIYLVSLFISFVAGLVALNASLGIYTVCDSSQGFQALGCIIGYITTLVVIAPIIAIVSLIVRLFAKNTKKYWTDIYVWAFFIIIFSLLNTIDQQMPSLLLKIVIFLFVFLFLVMPAILFRQNLIEKNTSGFKIKTKKVSIKKNSLTRKKVQKKKKAVKKKR